MVVAQQPNRSQGPVREPASLPVRLLGTFRHCAARSEGSMPDAAPQHLAQIDEHLGDMAAQYGVPYRGAPADGLGSAPEQTAYNTLAHRLLAEARSRGTRIERVVLAHSLPDSQPGYSVCAAMVESSPELTTAFAVSDQGVSAPFSALHVAAEYLRGEPEGRTLVMVLDQGALSWEVPEGTPVTGRDVGVALLLGGRHSPGRLPYWQFTGVGATDAVHAVTGIHAAVRRDLAGPMTFILGHHTPGPRVTDPHMTLRRGAADLVCTAVWSELHDLHAPERPGAVVVVEYDPVHGYLSAFATNLEAR
jgi:hypothetical protein